MLNKKLLLLCCTSGLALQVATAKTFEDTQSVGNKNNGSTTHSKSIHKKNNTSTISKNVTGITKDEKKFNASLLEKNAVSLIENIGQIKDQHGVVREDINFKLPGNHFDVFIGSAALHYQWSKTEKGSKKTSNYRMDVELLGANKNAAFSTSDIADYSENYRMSADVALQAKSFKKVSYKNVYPNIDWEIYLKNGKLEYDFIVHPGGNVADINIKYNGATKMKQKANGGIDAYTSYGYVAEHAPVSYSVITGTDKAVAVNSSFKLKDNVASFSVGKYNGTLIIDPVLDWGTYYGGAATEDGYGVGTDAQGNVYMTGYTLSTTNIATTGSYQSSFTPGVLSALDVYLVKFDSTGARQWATYYGSFGSESGYCLTTDRNGNVYVAGGTTSTSGIATAGSWQSNITGTNDGYLAKFSPAGNLLWATYYGGNPASGSSTDNPFGLICDKKGNVYMTGQTNSIDNIATPGSYHPSLLGGLDGYIVKFDSTGVRQWGSYLGGALTDQGRSLAIDNNYNIYIGGSTNSTTGIASTGAAQTTLGGANDAFVMKLDSTGTFKWATYYGGTDYDGAAGVSCDENSNVYLTGNLGATSTGLATTGSHQPTGGGNGDAFLVKYDSVGNKLWSTYYGGSGIEQGTGVQYDGFGNVYMIGNTKSTTAIATAGTYQDTISLNGTNYEAFLVKFKNDGTRIWSTYYGGKGDDYSKALVINPWSGDIIFSGQTKSTTHIATPGSHQDTIGSLNGTDAFVVKFKECPSISYLSLRSISGDDSLCPNITAIYATTPIMGVNSYTWTLPNGWTGTSDSASILVTTGITGGIIKVQASNDCDTTTAQSLQIYVFPFFEPVITVDSQTLGTASHYASYQWYLNEQLITGATDSTYHVTQNGDYKVAVVSVDGCTDTSAIYTVNNATTGLNDLNNIKSNINIYPNPATSVVYIKSPIKVNAMITNIEGRSLAHFKNVKSISIKDLAPGIYLMHIMESDGTFIKAEKFIKE